MPSELKSATSRANGAKSQGCAISSANALRRGLTAKTLLLPHENQDLFLAIWNAYFDLLRRANATEGYATALHTDIHLTRINRQAVDQLRLLRGVNFLNEIPVLQNEPENPNLTTMNSTSAAKKISTEPTEPKATQDSPDIPSCTDAPQPQASAWGIASSRLSPLMAIPRPV